MLEKDVPQPLYVTLEASEGNKFCRAVEETYGKGMQEIADIDPNFAFHALSTGFRALASKDRQRLVWESKGGTTVVDRREDGAQAFDGLVSLATDGLVIRLAERFVREERDLVIRTIKYPGFLGRLFRQSPATKTIATIHHELLPPDMD